MAQNDSEVKEANSKSMGKRRVGGPKVRIGLVPQALLNIFCSEWLPSPRENFQKLLPV